MKFTLIRVIKVLKVTKLFKTRYLLLGLLFVGFLLSLPKIESHQNEKQALGLVASLQEVKDFRKRIEDIGKTRPVVAIDSFPNTKNPYYSVHVYEEVQDNADYSHTATFNWYRVDPKTWTVTRLDLSVENEKWDIVDTNASSQSSPAVIKLKDFSNEHKLLAKPISLQEALKAPAYQDYSSGVKDNFTMFGILAGSFLPSEYIVYEDEFDVDMDGSKEIILGIAGIGGNHPPHYSVVIKDGSIIFRVDELQPTISSTGTNNGFYVDWIAWDQVKNGLCCPTGGMRTKFIFEKNKFTPIEEQEIASNKTATPIPSPTPTIVYKTITTECPSPKSYVCPTVSDQAASEVTQLKAEVDNKNKEIQQLKDNIKLLQTNIQAMQANSFYWQQQAAFCSINYQPRL